MNPKLAIRPAFRYHRLSRSQQFEELVVFLQKFLHMAEPLVSLDCVRNWFLDGDKVEQQGSEY